MSKTNKKITSDLDMISHSSRGILLLIIILLAFPIVILNVNEIAGKLSREAYKIKIEPYVPDPDPGIQYWHPFDIRRIQDSSFLTEVKYGQDLIAHTSKYFGPKGSINKLTNGMNCQNCHLNAGTKVYGNNYGSAFSDYPKVRSRSGTEVDLSMRVNDCFERSMNGEALDNNSREMKAILQYMNYISSNVKKGERAKGSGFKDLEYLDRPADPEKGKVVYDNKCASCHMANGQGVKMLDDVEYMYPPLWGDDSFNKGAGLYRLTNMSRYVKYNMPLGVEHDAPSLSDEEAWDVSAFLIVQDRPGFDNSKDWPDISKKPIDHPFGPYSDGFSEEQHKFGPYLPIIAARQK
jgi:thiosulfate dehydrogenase